MEIALEDRDSVAYRISMTWLKCNFLDKSNWESEIKSSDNTVSKVNICTICGYRKMKAWEFRMGILKGEMIWLRGMFHSVL